MKIEKKNFFLLRPLTLCIELFSYEQGLRASLGQDLSSLREQQNQINESLGDIMDSIDNQIEEPK